MPIKKLEVLDIQKDQTGDLFANVALYLTNNLILYLEVAFYDYLIPNPRSFRISGKGGPTGAKFSDFDLEGLTRVLQKSILRSLAEEVWKNRGAKIQMNG